MEGDRREGKDKTPPKARGTPPVWRRCVRGALRARPGPFPPPPARLRSAVLRSHHGGAGPCAGPQRPAPAAHLRYGPRGAWGGGGAAFWGVSSLFGYLCFLRERCPFGRFAACCRGAGGERGPSAVLVFRGVLAAGN